MRRLVLAVLVVGCSSHPPKTNGTGTGTGAAPPDAAPAAVEVDDGGTPLATEADCNAVIDHVLAVLMDELRARKPEDEWPTEDQIAEKRVGLVADFMGECRQLDRGVIACMLAARDSPSFQSCAIGPAQ